MDKEVFNLHNSSNSFENEDEKLEKNEKNEKNENSFLDNIGFETFFILNDDNDQSYNDNMNESDNNRDERDNKISIDLTDIKNTKIHNYLNEDLIDAIDKSFDDPKDNQCMSDLSHNENDTNYSQNNMSNDNDIYNNYSNMSNNYQNPQNLNSVHKTISFFPKMNRKKQNDDNNTNINNIKIIINDNNSEDKNKNIKKLVDYFGGNNLLDAPIYIPHKFKSLKFNQKPSDIGDNTYNNNNTNNITENNNDTEIKEEKCKKPFEIREGDWTCEFCYNLNFSFRTKCNRCGLIKDFLNIKKNLCMNNNDNFHNYKTLMQTNFYVCNNQSLNNYQYMKNNNFTNNNCYSPNNSNFA